MRHLFNITPHVFWEHLGQANDEQGEGTWQGGVMAKASVGFSQLEDYRRQVAWGHMCPPQWGGSSLVHKAKDLVGTGTELNSAKS